MVLVHGSRHADLTSLGLITQGRRRGKAIPHFVRRVVMQQEQRQLRIRTYRIRTIINAPPTLREYRQEACAWSDSNARGDGYATR